MERKGIRTERGNRNREINSIDRELYQLRARIVKLQKWVLAESNKPNLHDTVQKILSRKSSHYDTIRDVKTVANMLMFLDKNSISDVSDLENRVNEMYRKQSNIRGKLKPVERLLKTLDEHIKQADYYFEFKSIYEEYQTTKSKKQDTFRETHRREITLFESAQKYLGEVLNGRTTIPRKAWKSEREELSAKRDLLYREYYSLKDEVKKVERVKRAVEGVVREQPQRKREEHGLE